MRWCLFWLIFTWLKILPLKWANLLGILLYVNLIMHNLCLRTNCCEDILLQVLRTPDFRNCKSAHEIRKGGCFIKIFLQSSLKDIIIMIYVVNYLPFLIELTCKRCKGLYAMFMWFPYQLDCCRNLIVEQLSYRNFNEFDLNVVLGTGNELCFGLLLGNHLSLANACPYCEPSLRIWRAPLFFLFRVCYIV